MSEELRTLKDIKMKREIRKLKFGAVAESWIKYDDLRKEAVKWVKDFERTNEEEYGGIMNMQVPQWIKHFFNLTGEDLKEAKEE